MSAETVISPEAKMEAAEKAAARYQLYLEQKNAYKRWKQPHDREGAKHYHARLSEALKEGGFPNVSQALKYRRENKAK